MKFFFKTLVYFTIPFFCSFKGTLNSRLNDVIIFNSKIKKQENSKTIIGLKEYNCKKTLIEVKDLIVSYNYSLDAQYDIERHADIRFKIDVIIDENRQLEFYINDTIEKLKKQVVDSKVHILQTKLWENNYIQIDFTNETLMYYRGILYRIKCSQKKIAKNLSNSSAISILLNHNLFLFNKYNFAYEKPWRLPCPTMQKEER